MRHPNSVCNVQNGFIRLSITALLVLLVVFTSGYALAADQAETNGFEALLQAAVSLMLEHHPTLISQRSIVTEGEEVVLPGARFPLSVSFSSDVGTRLVENEVRLVPAVGVSVSLPFLDPKRMLDRATAERTLARELERDIQQLQAMEEKLTRELIASVEQLIQRQHHYQGLESLAVLLQERRVQQTDLVKAGMASSETVWALDERMTDVKIEMANLKTQSVLLIATTAYTFSGEAWQQMKSLLEDLTTSSEVINTNG